jgi:hypothetical protein
MAQRISSNSQIGQQNLFTPTWANIDFADFKGLNMDLISRNAEYTQNIANKRFEGLLDAQAKLLEEVKLGKRFDYLENDVKNKTAAILENAGNLQLSDNVNFTKLNTGLISLKNDPKLQQAIHSTEEAKKAKEIFDKDPTIESRPWDVPMYNKYKAFLNGETNDFELGPVYKDVDYLPIWDDFFSKLPKNEQTAIVKYGASGIAQAKEEGFNKEDLVKKIQDYKQFVTVNNANIKSNLERRGIWAKDQGLVPEEYIENFLNEGINASASKFAGVNRSLTQPQVDVNKEYALRERAETRIQRAQDQQDQLLAPYEFKGGVLIKGKKGAPPDVKTKFTNYAINNTPGILSNKIKLPNDNIPRDIIYEKSSIEPGIDGKPILRVVYKKGKKEESIPVILKSEVISGAQDFVNAVTATPTTTNSGTNW